jgi:hypothetical protein
LPDNDLSGWNFAGQYLTNASFDATLADADFTGAEVRGASFAWGGLTPAQLYSTASYQAHDLTEINLSLIDLYGWNFAGQKLTNAGLSLFCPFFPGGGCLDPTRILITADLTAADARGASIGQLSHLSTTTTTNLIWPDGHISGLDLDAGGLLVIRNYDGDSRYEPARPPISITVDQHLAMGPGGTLRMVFEADAWDSTISFAPGIPVTLGGTLELTFAADVNLASQVGRTFDLFDWTGVTPTGAFAISSPYQWNMSNLYSIGQVTLTAIPEPSSVALAVAVFVLVAIASCRVRIGSSLPTQSLRSGLAQQRPKARLLKVVIERERSLQASLLHHDKRNAIGQRPMFIRSQFVERQSLGKQFGCRVNKLPIRRGANLANRGVCFRTVDRVGKRVHQFPENVFRSDQPLLDSRRPLLRPLEQLIPWVQHSQQVASVDKDHERFGAP